MKKFLKQISIFASALVVATFAACKPAGGDVVIDPDDTGLYGIVSAENTVNNIGGEVSVKFLALGDWSVESDSDWCSIKPAEGKSGDGVITITVAANPDKEGERTATLTANIKGYQNNVPLCTITQNADEEEINGNDPNLWLDKIMTEKYLWNNEYVKIKSRLNYFMQPETFLNTALKTMSGNDEDGNVDATGNRFYYTNLAIYGMMGAPEYAPTRALSKKEDYGVTMVYPVGSPTQGNYYFLVASVSPDSPATDAKLERGMYITKWNGANINGSNLESIYNQLMGYAQPEGAVRLSIAKYNDNGKLVTEPDITVDPYAYSYNPVTFKGVFANKNNENQKIGYLVYSSFDMNGDDELLNTFQAFKANGVTDLILDLRYNGGGDVYSSAVMASAIVPQNYKGEIYCEMEFNEFRRSQGEVEYFYIGQDPSMVEYPQIAQASENTLGLTTVYVITTNFTASASELVINGIRGLGLQVYTIGLTSQGKNSGMEVMFSNDDAYDDYSFGGYQYVFSPITFYNKNAEGFKDFHSGFTTDFSDTETNYIPVAWGDANDPYLGAALTKIMKGNWPAATMSTRAASMPVVKEMTPRDLGARVYSKGYMSKFSN